MLHEPTSANDSLHAAGYGPPGGGGYGGPPPGGGGYGGPPGGGYGGPPGGGGYGGPPGGAPPGGFGPPPGPPGGPPPGGYGAPPPAFGPPGGFPPPGGPMMPGMGDDVNTTLPLILGILSIFCCWPVAILVIVFAVQAKTLKTQGQIEAARSKAKTATIIGGIIVGLGAVFWILYIILVVIGAATSH